MYSFMEEKVFITILVSTEFFKDRDEKVLGELVLQQLWKFYFGMLPEVLQLKILSYLEGSDLCALATTSKQMRKLAMDER